MFLGTEETLTHMCSILQGLSWRACNLRNSLILYITSWECMRRPEPLVRILAIRWKVQDVDVGRHTTIFSRTIVSKGIVMVIPVEDPVKHHYSHVWPYAVSICCMCSDHRTSIFSSASVSSAAGKLPQHGCAQYFMGCHTLTQPYDMTAHVFNLLNSSSSAGGCLDFIVISLCLNTKWIYNQPML